MTTETLTLTAFLLERIAEDESFALSAQAEASIYDEGTLRWHWLVAHSRGSRWHPTTFDPARVLAECEAKRRIVELHETVRAAYPGCTIETDPCCAPCSAWGEYPGEFPCDTLRALAAVYADHRDYREEWRP